MTENWKIYNKTYEVSDLGNVRSLRYKKNLKGSLNSAGYKRVQIGSSNNKKFIHRLVAEVFLKRTTEKNIVNHIDGNKLNNKATNLEWVTSSENKMHSIKNGTSKKNMFSNSKLTIKEVKEIKKIIKYDNLIDREIAEKYKVHRRTISDIRRKKTWNEIYI